MKTKRIFAYIIDFVIVSIIAQIILLLPLFSDATARYEEQSKSYANLLFNSTSGSTDITEEELIKESYELEKSAQSSTIITLGVTLLYFGVFAFINNGQTLGKKIFKMRVVSSDSNSLNPGLFILRATIITNLIPKIINVIAISKASLDTWYFIETITGNISYIILFVTLGFMIFRDDEKGLHDILCKTKVIEENKD